MTGEKIQFDARFQLILFDLIGKVRSFPREETRLIASSFQLILFDLIGKAPRRSLCNPCCCVSN